MSEATTHTHLTYNDHSIEIASLPQTSLVALANRGLGRFLGSEISSKVINWAAGVEKETKEAPSDEAKAAKKAEFVTLALKALSDGTIGVRAPRAESVDPVEREMERIAKRMVRDKLQAANITAPKGDEKLKFEDGQEFTMDDLVERQLAKAEEAIRKEAQKVLKAKADAKAKAVAAAEAAKSTGPVSAESLGF